MKSNEKSQTIKIDIRSLGHGHVDGAQSENGAAPSTYFDRLDYRFLFEHAYDAILLADSRGTVVAANTRADDFFGYGAGGLARRSLKTLVAGVTPSLLREIQDVIAQGRYMRIQAFAVRKDGALLAVEAVVMGNGTRSPEPVCYLIRDIQSRWDAEQKLLSAYHAMDNTDAGIGIADMRGVVTYANRMMAELLGAGDESAVVGHHLDTWFDHKAVLDPMLKNIRAGKGWLGEQRQFGGDRAGWLQVSAVPDLNEDEELCGMVLSVRDTAERRRAEIAEQQAERSRVLAESLSTACHALGQPATVLLTSIEMLKIDDALDEATRKEMIEMCYHAAIQLRERVRQLLCAAHCEVPDREEGTE
jgi:PAS domain S-box-containing protein